MQEALKKVCKKCSIQKLWIEFPRSSDNLDGFENTCKECVKTERNVREGKKKGNKFHNPFHHFDFGFKR